MKITLCQQMNLLNVLEEILSEDEYTKLKGSTAWEFQYDLSCEVSSEKVSVEPMSTDDLSKALDQLQRDVSIDDTQHLIDIAIAIYQASVVVSESCDASNRAFWAAREYLSDAAAEDARLLSA